MGFGVGFGSISVGVWLTVGCRAAHSGLRGGLWWVCGVARGGGFYFWLIPMVLGVVFFFFFMFFLFYIAPNTQCKIFVGSFS